MKKKVNSRIELLLVSHSDFAAAKETGPRSFVSGVEVGVLLCRAVSSHGGELRVDLLNNGELQLSGFLVVVLLNATDDTLKRGGFNIIEGKPGFNVQGPDTGEITLDGFWLQSLDAKE